MKEIYQKIYTHYITLGYCKTCAIACATCAIGKTADYSGYYLNIFLRMMSGKINPYTYDN